MYAKLRFVAEFLVVQFFCLSFAHARIDAVLGPVELNKNLNLSKLVPQTDLSEIIISRDQYVISYNKERRAPNWVAWKLEADQIGKSGRSKNFDSDSELEKYLETQPGNFHAVTPQDYKDSCFDRGHQVPSADRTDSEANNSMTFLMSNMVPQTAHLNRIIWEQLERYTRSLVQNQGKKIYIIAGPIYDEDFGSIGIQNKIPVPSKDFKILVILDANQTLNDISDKTPIISVIMPNLLANGDKPLNHEEVCQASISQPSPHHNNVSNVSNVSIVPNSNDDWKQYQTTIQEIEKESGLKILPEQKNE